MIKGGGKIKIKGGKIKIKGGGSLKVGGGAAAAAAGAMKMGGGVQAGAAGGGGGSLGLAGGAQAGAAGGGGFSSSWSTKTAGGRTIEDEDEPTVEELSQKLFALKKKKKEKAELNLIKAIKGQSIKIKKPVLAKKFVNLMEDLAGKLAVNKLLVAEEFVKKLKKQKEEEVYSSIGITRSIKNKKSKHKNNINKVNKKKHSVEKIHNQNNVYRRYV